MRGELGKEKIKTGEGKVEKMGELDETAKKEILERLDETTERTTSFLEGPSIPEEMREKARQVLLTIKSVNERVRQEVKNGKISREAYKIIVNVPTRKEIEAEKNKLDAGDLVNAYDKSIVGHDGSLTILKLFSHSSEELDVQKGNRSKVEKTLWKRLPEEERVERYIV